MTTTMKILQIATAGIAHPFGDDRAVRQAFPAGISKEISDPFLMCDYFDVIEDTGISDDPNHYPVGWHPHRGFSIASYFKTGIGRHADSLGNRETFATPGMQWMNTGSGVEHAEGGATPLGERIQGFQIWINVRKEDKLNDPDYGTVPPDDIPPLNVGKHCTARVLAGNLFGVTGPFRTKVPFQMADIEMKDQSELTFQVDPNMDTTFLYVYEGAGITYGTEHVPAQSIVVLDATLPSSRTVHVKCEQEATSFLLFVGKKIREPIAWHGPIVMNTPEEIRDTFREMQKGTFPPKRVSWDYRDYKSGQKQHS